MAEPEEQRERKTRDDRPRHTPQQRADDDADTAAAEDPAYTPQARTDLAEDDEDDTG